MKPTVLLFHVNAKTTAAIRVRGQKLQFRTIVVPAGRCGHTIGNLLAGTAEDCPAAQPFDEEMLVMDLPGVLMDFFLQGLRRQKADVSLKAALTPTNVDWTADALCRELQREREAFRAGKVADHAEQP